MKRSRYFVLLLALTLAGCFDKPYPEEREGWSASRWQQAQKEDQQRLLSEDQRNSGGVLAPVKKAGSGAWELITRIYNQATGNTPFDAVKNMLNTDAPDLRREAVVYLSKRPYGRNDPYISYYIELARSDVDYTVRAMAIRALNRARAAQATDLFIAALDDKNELVRLEAAKALANIPDANATSALIKRLGNADEGTDVRIAAADALRNFKTIESAQALVRVLQDRNFGVAWQARRSLRLMTGQDLRYDTVAWLTLLSGSDNPLG